MWWPTGLFCDFDIIQKITGQGNQSEVWVRERICNCEQGEESQEVFAASLFIRAQSAVVD